MTSNQSDPTTRKADVASALFEKQWGTYRKVVANNLMYHREAYGELRRVLDAEAPRPFHFLDVACGDSSSSVDALMNAPVASYRGIDVSRPALNLANANIEKLDCQKSLEQRDFVDALHTWPHPVDVIWIGMSLHHLQSPGKIAVMRNIHEHLESDGLFIVWEPTLLEGEDSSGWNNRFCSMRPDWTALSDEEFAVMDGHNRTADYQETAHDWLRMGREAGFSQANEIFRSPNDLHRAYLFQQ